MHLFIRRKWSLQNRSHIYVRCLSWKIHFQIDHTDTASISTAQRWLQRFRSGVGTVEDAPRFCRSVAKIIDTIKEMIEARVSIFFSIRNIALELQNYAFA